MSHHQQQKSINLWQQWRRLCQLSSGRHQKILSIHCPEFLMHVIQFYSFMCCDNIFHRPYQVSVGQSPTYMQKQGFETIKINPKDDSGEAPTVTIPVQIDLNLPNKEPETEAKEQPLSPVSKDSELVTLLTAFLARLATMTKQVKANPDLRVYFVKAGTNSDQIQEGLVKLQQLIAKIKACVDKEGTNLFILGAAFKFFQEYFGAKDFDKLCNFEKAYGIMDLSFKLDCCIELLQGSLTLPVDITTLPKQKYENVWKFIKFEVCGREDKVTEGLLYMKRMLGITTSAVLNEQEKKGAFTKVMAFGMSYPQYYFSDKESLLRSMNFYRKPTVEVAQKIWNLPENGLTRELTKLTMKSIKTNLKIYIPAIYPNQKPPQDILKYNPEAIQVRVLHNDSLYEPNRSSGFKGMCCGGSGEAEPPSQISTVVVHMHGGGFLALSSRSMQTYTRKWARKLKVPVFSIDYRMPPSYRFPTAPYDCLAVYAFITQHISKYFNIRPKKIILAGDSAGGNLACSLMGLILLNKLQVPHGIYVAYPACDLRRIFSPSRIFSFNDPLLNPSMLMLCLRQYLNNKHEYETSPLASPVLFTEQFVGGEKGDQRFPLKWPKTIIQVGAKDPLYDDSLRLMERLVSSNIECECQVYQNLSHGFLNLDFAVPDCAGTITDSIRHLKRLIDQISIS